MNVWISEKPLLSTKIALKLVVLKLVQCKVEFSTYYKMFDDHY